MATAANIRVMARVNPRPGDICLRVEGDTIVPIEEHGNPHHHKFNFDNVFTTDSTQESVFSSVGIPTVDRIMEGYNGTVFAYGQTGSGKTHTMLAPEGGSPKCLQPQNAELYRSRGLIPRIVDELFKRLSQLRGGKKGFSYAVQASYYEIYNEELIDLLSDRAEKDAKLAQKIRLEGTKETFRISGLVGVGIHAPEELLTIMQEGATKRHIASTKMNDTSSRSHSICQIKVVQEDDVLKNVTTSQLNLVDLAGCESLGKTGAKGQTAYEGTRINLSLTTLGIVISQLCKNEKYISFRDSLLTRVLQNSLGGNAITTLVVTMSQLRSNYSDTLSVLRFSERAKQVRNKARINKQRTAAEWQLLFKQAEEEIETLKQRLALASPAQRVTVQSEDEVNELKARLEAVLEELQAQKELVDEKEKALFASEKKAEAAVVDYEEMKQNAMMHELEKIEQTAMFDTTMENLKKTEQVLDRERSGKKKLQSSIKSLEVSLAGSREELKLQAETCRRQEIAEVEKAKDLAAAKDEILTLKRRLAEEKEQAAKTEAAVENDRLLAKDREAALRQQIATLKGLTQDTTIEAAITAALEQQTGTMDVLKAENAALRDEAQALKKQKVAFVAEKVTSAAELEQAQKRVEALSAIADKNKAWHQEMLGSVKRAAEDIAALKQENTTLAESLASETARLQAALCNLQGDRDNVQRDHDSLKDSLEKAKVELEQKAAESHEHESRIRELELIESRYENEAESNRALVDKLSKENSTYTKQLAVQDQTRAMVKEAVEKLAELVGQSKSLSNPERTAMLEVMQGVIEPSAGDMIDQLARKLYDTRAQHELVLYVDVVLEERAEDVHKLDEKIRLLLQQGDCVPESIKGRIDFIMKQFEKIMSVMENHEFNDMEDESRRQDIVQDSRTLSAKAEQLADAIKNAAQAETAICPICQNAFSKDEIKRHANRCLTAAS